MKKKQGKKVFPRREDGRAPHKSPGGENGLNAKKGKRTRSHKTRFSTSTKGSIAAKKGSATLTRRRPGKVKKNLLTIVKTSRIAEVRFAKDEPLTRYRQAYEERKTAQSNGLDSWGEKTQDWPD